MSNEQKKKVTKEDFVQILTTMPTKKMQLNNDKKYWDNFEEKNTTKSKFRW